MSKNVILGVTGSIAAYKAAELTSLLVKQGCDVRVVLTEDALKFITPLAFKTLSRHPVSTDLYDEEEGWKPVHIEMADAAGLLLVAPATANTIAKLALGLANDALSCVALALNPLLPKPRRRKLPVEALTPMRFAPAIFGGALFCAFLSLPPR